MDQVVSNILNFIDSGIDAAAKLVAANNPAYADDIALISGTVDSLNAKYNPTAPAASAAIAQAASDLAAAVPEVTSAPTVASKTATAAQKAGVIGSLIGTIETIGGDIIGLFHLGSSTSSAPATVTPAAVPAAPAPYVSVNPQPTS